MSDMKLTQLPAAGTLSGTEPIYLVQGGSSVRTTVTELLAFFKVFSQDVDADGFTLKDFVFTGALDTYYDLAADSDNLITTGTASLTQAHNAYMYKDLNSALEIEFPDSSGLAAGEAPFGIIAISLDSSGSVTIGAGEDWQWERPSSADPNPTIPTEPGSHFRLRYSYDPITEAYLVSMSQATYTPPVANTVKYVPGSATVSSLSQANKDIFDHTHPLTSTIQDGSRYLIVGFFADGDAAPTVVPDFLTAITTPPTGAGTHVQGRWYRYKFTQDDITAGSISLSFAKNNEMAQIVAFEIEGADTSAPIGDVDHDRSTSSVRGTAGPVELTVPNNSLMVASVSVDAANPVSDFSASSLNDFTQIIAYAASTSGSVSFKVFIREVATGGNIDTPTFARDDANSGTVQVEAFVIVPPA